MSDGISYVPRVLVIDDDVTHIKLVHRTLEEEKDLEPKDETFKILAVMTPEAATPYIDEDSIDIYLVDLKFGADTVTLEDSTQVGKDLIGRIRHDSNAAIAVYSSELEQAELVSSIAAGADAYIRKSLGPAVLKANVCALWRTIQFRRPITRGFPIHQNKVFRIGPWVFSVESRAIEHRSGLSVRLSRLEFALLRHLVTTGDHEVGREDYFAYVLGRKFKPGDRGLDAVVDRLRAKLGDEVQLVSVRDVGYRLLGVTSN